MVLRLLLVTLVKLVYIDDSMDVASDYYVIVYTAICRFGGILLYCYFQIFNFPYSNVAVWQR